MNLSSLPSELVEEFKSLYGSETQQVGTLTRMRRAAREKGVSCTLDDHLVQTRAQIERLEKAFALAGVPPVGQPAMFLDSLTVELGALIRDVQPGPMRDAMILRAHQRIELLEISAYEHALHMAVKAGAEVVVDLLADNLEEEKESLEALRRAERVLAQDSRPATNGDGLWRQVAGVAGRP